MTTDTVNRQAGQGTTFRDVFAEREYTALWLAQLTSFAGDQFARVALAVLVYDRTRSPLLAAVAFAVTTGAMTLGSLFLSWTADVYPRRTVMVICDVICAVLVLVMAVPGVPLAALIVLLFAVSLAVEPVLTARMVTNKEVLGGKFQLGLGVTLATYQVAQLIGLAAGGIVVAAVGVRTALLIDAGTFAVSAVLVRFGLRTPHAPEERGARPDVLGGIRLVLGSPVARTAMFLIWMAAFFSVPEGVAVPLARDLGGGAAYVGWLLAAMCAGSAIGALAWPRFVSPARRLRYTAVSAGAACVVLTELALNFRLAGVLAVLVVSGLLTGYIATASDVLFDAIPAGHRGRASGVVGAGMAAGQAIGILAGGAVAQVLAPAMVIALAGLAGTLTAIPLAVAWRRTRTRTGNPRRGGPHRGASA